MSFCLPLPFSLLQSGKLISLFFFSCEVSLLGSFGCCFFGALAYITFEDQWPDFAERF